MSDMSLEGPHIEYLHTEGYVWECGDDCECTQAVVYQVFRDSSTTPPHYERRSLWAGTFYSEWSGGTDLAPSELANYRKLLREFAPEVEAQVKWQEGIDYDD